MRENVAILASKEDDEALTFQGRQQLGKYIVNEAYIDSFPEPYQEYLRGLRGGMMGRQYSSR